MKSQGSCASGYAFSAASAMESWYILKYPGRAPNDFSQQQFVDCSSSYGNQGCQGGWPIYAMKYNQNKGGSGELSYPYIGVQGTCKKEGGSPRLDSISTFSGIDGLTNGLSKHPISVIVDASNWGKYSSGVFSNCGTNVNHAALLVGIIGGNWKLKNSFSTSWG